MANETDLNRTYKETGKSLKQQTIFSLLWNAFDKIGFQVIAFLIGIVTLRLLSPSDFGLMGALAIFTALSNILIESGFTSAMVRRKENKESEYSAILLFNIFLSLTFYLILYFSAEYISKLYDMELTNLARFLFLSIIFNSLCIVQNIILTRSLSFKLLSITNITGAVVAGIVTLILISQGYTYWALAWQILLQSAVKCILLWIFSSWRPTEKPDFKIIKEVFSFSFSLILSSLANTFVKYIYNPIIGKRFEEEELGYYSEAYKFFNLPSSIVSNTITGVSYPVLSKLNKEEDRQVVYLRKLVRMTAFCIFPILLGAIACFDNIVHVVLTEKWAPIVPYFRILAIAGVVMPFHSLYLGVLTLKGFPKRNFTMEMIRNALIIVPLFFVYQNMEWMLWSFTIANLLSYFCDLFFVKSVVKYKVTEQIKDLIPYMGLSIIMAFFVYFTVPAIHWVESQIGCDIARHWIVLTQIVVGATVYISGCYLSGSTIMKEMLGLLKAGRPQQG